MNRVPVHTFDSVSGAARPILEHVIEASPGATGVLNIWGAMAGAPVTLAVYMGIRDAIAAHALLDPKTRTAITLTAGSVIGGAYAQSLNSRVAQHTGWTVEETRAIRAGEPMLPRLDALLAVVREATADHGRVRDAAWYRAKAAGWSDSELVEAFTFVVLAVVVDDFANFVELEVDASPTAPAMPAAGTAA